MPDLGAALAGRPHRRARLVRDRDARDLVVEELGVAGGDEREHPEQDRHRDAARPEPPPGLREHRLDLRLEYSGWVITRCAPAASFRSRRSHSVAASAAVESSAQAIVKPARWPIDRAGRVLGEVEPGQHLDQPDRIDVPDPGPGRVVADPRRVAGQGDDVADAERVGAEQLRLEGHQVPVARRAVDEALEVEVVLDPERHRQRAHPDPGHRRVGDVDEVDAGVAQEPGGLDRPLDPDAPRRVDLDRDDEPARPASSSARRVGGGASSVTVGGGPDAATARVTARWPARRRRGATEPGIARPSTSSAARIAAMCSGVVPQQPPTIRAPAASRRGVTVPKYSALAA